MSPDETVKLHTECINDLPKVVPDAAEQEKHVAKLLGLDRAGYERGSDGAIAELLSSVHFRRGLSLLAAGKAEAGWQDLFEALDYFEHALRCQIVGVYVPEKYSRSNIVPIIFVEMIGLAFAAQDITRAKWAAGHLDTLFETKVVSRSIRDDEAFGLFDAVTTGLASGDWPEDASAATGNSSYAALFGDLSDRSALKKALYACCDFHMERIARGTKLREEPPENVFISVPWAAMPLELLYWRGLYELHFGPLDIDVDHVLWLSPLLQSRPAHRPKRADIFEKIGAKAREVWGEEWDKAGVK